MILILFIILLCIIISTRETFIHDIFPNNVIPIIDFNWWKPKLRYTKNMSYDLRGNPLIIPAREYVWNNPKVVPKFNRDTTNKFCV
jgi:hypothetical protein